MNGKIEVTSEEGVSWTVDKDGYAGISSVYDTESADNFKIPVALIEGEMGGYNNIILNDKQVEIGNSFQALNVMKLLEKITYQID